MSRALHSRRRIPRFACLACLWGSLCAQAFADAQVTVERIDGQPLSASVWSIRGEALSLGDPPTDLIPLKNIVAIRARQALSDWTQRTSIVWFTNGDQLIATPTEIADDVLTARWLRYPQRPVMKLPLEHVRAICLQTPPSVTGRLTLFRELAVERQRGDLAWLLSGDRVSGEFTGTQVGEYRFQTPAGKLAIVREKLLALRLDPELHAFIKPPETRWLLSLTDGTRLTVGKWDKSGEKLAFTTLHGEQVELPAEAFLACQAFSPRVHALSARKPGLVTTQSYLGGTSLSWGKDRNDRHGPLQMRGQEFATGFGVHSQTSLRFPLNAKDREFRATVGIDDLADGAGQVVFMVQVDERVVWTSPGLTGSSDPLAIPPIPVQGGKDLTLTVGFGELGDIADHADWCDPVMIRDP